MDLRATERARLGPQGVGESISRWSPAIGYDVTARPEERERHGDWRVERVVSGEGCPDAPFRERLGDARGATVKEALGEWCDGGEAEGGREVRDEGRGDQLEVGEGVGALQARVEPAEP